MNTKGSIWRAINWQKAFYSLNLPIFSTPKFFQIQYVKNSQALTIYVLKCALLKLFYIAHMYVYTYMYIVITVHSSQTNVIVSVKLYSQYGEPVQHNLVLSLVALVFLMPRQVNFPTKLYNTLCLCK